MSPMAAVTVAGSYTRERLAPTMTGWSAESATPMGSRAATMVEKRIVEAVHVSRMRTWWQLFELQMKAARQMLRHEKRAVLNSLCSRGRTAGYEETSRQPTSSYAPRLAWKRSFFAQDRSLDGDHDICQWHEPRVKLGLAINGL